MYSTVLGAMLIVEELEISLKKIDRKYKSEYLLTCGIVVDAWSGVFFLTGFRCEVTHRWKCRWHLQQERKKLDSLFSSSLHTHSARARTHTLTVLTVHQARALPGRRRLRSKNTHLI